MIINSQYVWDFGGDGSTPNQDLLGSLGAQQEVLDQWDVATWIYQLVICSCYEKTAEL